MAQLYNIIGSGSEPPPGGAFSWRDFWDDRTQEHWPDECQSGNCQNFPTEGTHLAEHPHAQPGRHRVFIAPFCTDHNEKPTTFAHSVADPYLCPL